MAGPLFQPIRGLLFAIAFFPLRSVLFGQRCRLAAHVADTCDGGHSLHLRSVSRICRGNDLHSIPHPTSAKCGRRLADCACGGSRRDLEQPAVTAWKTHGTHRSLTVAATRLMVPHPDHTCSRCTPVKRLRRVGWTGNGNPECALPETSHPSQQAVCSGHARCLPRVAVLENRLLIAIEQSRVEAKRDFTCPTFLAAENRAGREHTLASAQYSFRSVSISDRASFSCDR